MSLSEHFEMNFKFPVTKNGNQTTDYLYQTSPDAAGLQAGNWGLMRTYKTKQDDLVPLPSNDITKNPVSEMKQDCGCPDDAPRRTFYVAAFSVKAAFGDSLVYNSKFGNKEADALVFVGAESETALDTTALKAYWKKEPMVLRARAGDCIKVHLTNAIPSDYISNIENVYRNL